MLLDLLMRYASMWVSSIHLRCVFSLNLMVVGGHLTLVKCRALL